MRCVGWLLRKLWTPNSNVPFGPSRRVPLRSAVGTSEMSKKNGAKQRARYTLEFKLEAVMLVKGGQESSMTARLFGAPKQTLSNWVRLADKGELQGAVDKPVSAEQMELARLHAELARVKMARDILKKATAYFAKVSL